MFKSITIKPFNENRFPVNPGFIAESLLFYESVNLQIHNHLLFDLINPIGVDQLIHLIEKRNLKVSLWGNLLAVANEPQQICLVQVPVDVEKLIYLGLENRTKRKGYSRRVASRLAKHIDSYCNDDKILTTITDDLKDSQYMKSLISSSLQNVNEKIIVNEKDILYEYFPKGKGHHMNTNIDFKKINEVFNTDLGVPSIINWASNVRQDLQLSMDNDSELATDHITMSQMKIKFDHIVKKFDKSANNLFHFNDFLLPSGKALQEAINNKTKSFDDFIKVLDESYRFKTWLSEVDSDRSVIKEYHEAVTEDSWVDKLPTKTFRWTIFTLLGATVDNFNDTSGLGTLTGLSLGAADTFLLDKVMKGWKPNMFVDSHLKPFVKNKD